MSAVTSAVMSAVTSAVMSAGMSAGMSAVMSAFISAFISAFVSASRPRHLHDHSHNHSSHYPNHNSSHSQSEPTGTLTPSLGISPPKVHNIRLPEDATPEQHEAALRKALAAEVSNRERAEVCFSHSPISPICHTPFPLYITSIYF